MGRRNSCGSGPLPAPRRSSRYCGVPPPRVHLKRPRSSRDVGLLLALPALCVYFVDLGRGTFHWDIPQGATVLQVPGPGPQPARTFRLLSGVSITSDQMVVLAVALLILVALTVFLRGSRTGLKLRALADLRELAAMRGISEPRMSRLAWVLGTVLAGVVGVVGAPLLHALNSDNYVFAVFIAICAAVIGGFRSVLLAAVGVVAISLISDLVLSYWTWASNVPGFNDSVPFVFLVVGLIVLGRFGGRVAGSISAEPPPPEYRRICRRGVDCCLRVSAS